MMPGTSALARDLSLQCRSAASPTGSPAREHSKVRVKVEKKAFDKVLGKLIQTKPSPPKIKLAKSGIRRTLTTVNLDY